MRCLFCFRRNSRRNPPERSPEEQKTPKKGGLKSQSEPVFGLNREKTNTLINAWLRYTQPSKSHQWFPGLSEIVFDYCEVQGKIDSSIREIAKLEDSFYASADLFLLLLEEICELQLAKNDVDYTVKYIRKLLHNSFVYNKEALEGILKKSSEENNNRFSFTVKDSSIYKNSQFSGSNINIFIKNNVYIDFIFNEVYLRVSLLIRDPADVSLVGNVSAFSSEIILSRFKEQEIFTRSLLRGEDFWEEIPDKEEVTDKEQINKEKSWMLRDVQSMIEQYENKDLIKNKEKGLRRKG